MANYKITLACRNNDRVDAVLRGQVKPEGIDLDLQEMDSVPRMVERMFNGEFDVSEFSLAELVYYTSRGRSDFAGIPVFPFRMFRHNSIFCSPAIDRPEALDGKRVGFPRLVQTACVWQRGILIEEHGLSPKQTQWYMSYLHHWENGHGEEEVRPHDGSTIHLIGEGGKDADETIDQALIDERIDAFGTTRPSRSFNAGDRRIKRLFENHREVEASYFKKTKIFPIMHVLVARRSVVEEHPELPRKLFELFTRSRLLGRERATTQADRNTFQEDPWTYGLDKNAAVIDKFLLYSHNAGVSARKMSPQELFFPTTWDLQEAS